MSTRELCKIINFKIYWNIKKTLFLYNIWPRCNCLKIWNLKVQKKRNIEKISFKFVQMKSIAMHITNKKRSFDIFKVGNLAKYLHGTWSLHNILMIFGIKEKSIILTDTQCIVGYCYKYTPCSDLRLVLCSRATNIKYAFKSYGRGK